MNPSGAGLGARAFISHASRDSETASRLVDALESRGVVCWVAPRDVPLGSDYADEIARAIQGAGAMVFLLSAASSASQHCVREVEMAIHSDVPVLPVRLDDATPQGGLAYRLSTAQWIDAMSAGMEDRLAEGVLAVIGRSGADGAVPVSPEPPTTALIADPSADWKPQARSGTGKANAPLALAGREPELRRLEQVISATVQNDDGVLILLGGATGVGKSALASSLVSYASDAGFVTVSSTCENFSEASAFFPIRELMRQITRGSSLTDHLAGIYGRDSSEASMSRVIESAIAEPSARRDAVLGTFANLILGSLRRDRDGPLLLLLEDLENADAGTVDCLLSLMSRLAEGPVVVIGTYRTDLARGPANAPLQHLLKAATRQSERTVRVELGPLPRESYPQLIARQLGGKVNLPTALVDKLWENTAGNALFLTETIRSLRNTTEGESPLPRFTQDDSGTWRFFGSIDAWSPPSSISEALQDNLGRVQEADRDELETASVIGKRFEFSVAAEVSQVDSDQLLDALERCMDQALINETRDSNDSFEFSHPLIREVLYDSVTRVRRRRVHSRVADVILGLPGAPTPERASRLGEHLFRARRFAEAIPFLDQSARRLTDLHQGAPAASLLRQLLTAIDESGTVDDGERARVAIRRVRALKISSDYDVALDECRELLNTLAPGSEGWACDELGDLLWAVGRPDEAEVQYGRAEQIAQATGDVQLQLEVCADLAEFHEREFERLTAVDAPRAAEHKRLSDEYVDRQLDLANRSDDAAARSRAYRNAAKKMRKAGDVAQALLLYEQSLALTDVRVASHHVLISYAKTLRFAGRTQEATEVVTRVLAWSTQIGARRSMGIALHYRAMLALAAHGPQPESWRDLEDALLLHEEIGYERGRWEVRTLRGEWQAAAGHWDLALAEFRSALSAPSTDDSAIIAMIGQQIRAIDEKDRAERLELSWRTRVVG